MMSQSRVYVPTTPSIVLAHTDFNPTAGTSLTGAARTHALNLSGLAAGSYRQSAKIDFGRLFADEWLMVAAIEPVSAPAAAGTDPAGTVRFYLGYSNNATAAQNNSANLSGADAAYVGYGAAAADAAEAVKQLEEVGFIPATADADTHVGVVGVFRPLMRYASLVVWNNFSVALAADGVEQSVQLFPMRDIAVK